MADISSIIYPECHLDSPIVTGKLIELLMYANLPHDQPLQDKTLIDNINVNKSKHKKTPLIIAQEEFGTYAIEAGLNVKHIKHIPYPKGNEELFNIQDSQLTRKLNNLIKLSHTCYSKISQRIVKLKRMVEDKIGMQDVPSYNNDQERFNEASITNLHLKFESSKWFKPFLFWFTIKTEVRDMTQTQTIDIKESPQHRRNTESSRIHRQPQTVGAFNA